MSHYVDDHNAHVKQELAQKLKAAEEEERRKAVRERKRFKGLQIRPTASYYDDAEEREPGEDNWVGFGFDIHPQVTFLSTGILVAFILLTVMFRKEANELFNSAMSFISGNFGWFLILAANIYILSALFFAFSRFGTIRIGGNEAKPEFTTLAWFSMLLSAGMGIGLMFWSVGEPITHFSSPSPMFSGGLVALQTAAVSTGLPFAVVLLLAVYALYIGFSQEMFVEDAVKRRLKRVEEEHRFAHAIEEAGKEQD